MTVLLTTEGTYPFSGGGVSTWCDTLIRSTPEVRYVLLPLTMNPHVAQKYTLPSNVRKMHRVPLWGIEEPAEFIREIPFATMYGRKHDTPEAEIEREFLAPFLAFVAEAMSVEPDSMAVGRALLAMEDFFRSRDYNLTMKSRAVWRGFTDAMRGHGRTLVARHPAGELCAPSLYDLTECLRWLYHFLIVLNAPVQRVTVTHSTAAGFCSIPCITSKLRNGTPMVLTEHGVYLREQNLAVAKGKESFFGRNFLLGLITAVARASYFFADVVAPVCQYNTRWEVAHGTPRDRIRVIYNGVDSDRFAPGERSVEASHVIATARIDPLKDIETFLRVAAKVRATHPVVRFSIYGVVSDRAYFERCVALRRELGLEAAVTMGSPTDDVVSAYQGADLVLLTSISEAFPYSVIEAMSCGRPVVASDVGGVGEALEGCGLIVRPRDVDGFAAAVTKLLDDPLLRARLSARARQKAVEQFRLEANIDAYLQVYGALAKGAAA